MICVTTPELEKYMKEYKKRFGEYYPLYYIQGTPEKNIHLIKKCLDKDKTLPRSMYEDRLKSLYGDNFDQVDFKVKSEDDLETSYYGLKKRIDQKPVQRSFLFREFNMGIHTGKR